MFRRLIRFIKGVEPHVLDLTVWTTQDGRVLSPSNLQMTEQHIQNTIKFLQKPSVADRLRRHDRLPYRWYSIDKYIEKRVIGSTIWNELHRGLAFHSVANEIVDEEFKRLSSEYNKTSKHIRELYRKKKPASTYEEELQDNAPRGQF